jgi:hypothetical protein
MDLLTNATVADDAIWFVAANKELAVRTKATVIYETEINQQNDMRPFNEIRDDLQETHQQADNDPSTRTTNEIF